MKITEINMTLTTPKEKFTIKYLDNCDISLIYNPSKISSELIVDLLISLSEIYYLLSGDELILKQQPRKPRKIYQYEICNETIKAYVNLTFDDVFVVYRALIFWVYIHQRNFYICTRKNKNHVTNY